MKALETSEFYNYWLKKYHNTTVEEIIEEEPELLMTPDWYKKYAVTQAQHDEWYEWSINRIAKHYKCGRVHARRQFAFDYLNIAPSIVKEEIIEPMEELERKADIWRKKNTKNK